MNFAEYIRKNLNRIGQMEIILHDNTLHKLNPSQDVVLDDGIIVVGLMSPSPTEEGQPVVVRNRDVFVPFTSIAVVEIGMEKTIRGTVNLKKVSKNKSKMEVVDVNISPLTKKRVRDIE